MLQWLDFSHSELCPYRDPDQLQTSGLPALESALDCLEGCLKVAGKAFLVGNSLSVADIVVALDLVPLLASRRLLKRRKAVLGWHRRVMAADAFGGIPLLAPFRVVLDKQQGKKQVRTTY